MGRLTWHAITIGRLFGIRLDVNLSWFVIFGLLAWTLGGVYFPQSHPRWPAVLAWGVGLVASVLFFGCVVLHELAHSLVALKARLPVRSITLFVFGGVSRIGREPASPGAELKIALAGPGASLLLGLTFGAIWLAARGLDRPVREPVQALALWLAAVNTTLALFNLLPGFPLDGGRVLRALIWSASEDSHWASRVAARAGQAIALALVAAGLGLALRAERFGVNGMWLVLIGWFLFAAASGSYRIAALRETLRDLRVVDVMRADVDAVSSSVTLQDLESATSGRPLFAVYEGDQLVGTLSSAELRRVPHSRWPTVTAGETAAGLAHTSSLDPDQAAGSALEEMLAGDHPALPVVDADGSLLGLVMRDDLLQAASRRGRR